MYFVVFCDDCHIPDDSNYKGANTVSYILIPFTFIIEKLLNLALKISDSGGITAILLSLFVTIALIPVYYVLEWSQEKEKDKTRELDIELEKIKRVKNSQERYFYTKELYRQYHYSPLSSLKGLIGLAIQIPFFAAAYSVLRNADTFAGVAFLGIKDLACPDGLLWGIHLLPLLMTAVNILGAIFVYKFAKKQELIQQVVVALIFLVLLYAQPAFLVLYWLMNNVFAVFRDMLFKKMFAHKQALKRSKQERQTATINMGSFIGAVQKTCTAASNPIVVIIAELGLGYVVFAWIMLFLGGWREPFFFFPLAKMSFIYAFCNVFLLSVVFFKRLFDEYTAQRDTLPVKSIVQLIISLLCTLFEGQILCLFVYPIVPEVNTYRLQMIGFAVASIHAIFLVWFMYGCRISKRLRMFDKNKVTIDSKTSILTATTFFVFLIAVPLQLVFSNITDVAIPLGDLIPQMLFIPLCVFAFSVVASFFIKDKRAVTGVLLFCLISGVVFWKGTNKGFLFKSFLLEDESILKPTVLQTMAESLVLFVLITGITYVLYLTTKKIKKTCTIIQYTSMLLLLFVCVDTVSVYGANTKTIKTHMTSLRPTANTKYDSLSLSKNKNAIVFFLDAASSNVFNAILENEPSIRQKLADFTWYKNNTSLGCCTELAAPAMFGGESFAPSLHLHNQNVYENTPNLYAKSIEKFINQNMEKNRSVSFSGERQDVFFPSIDNALYSNNQSYTPLTSERKKEYYKNTFLPVSLISISPRLFKSSVFFGFKSGIIENAKNTDVFNRYKMLADLPFYQLDFIDSEENILVFHSLVTHGPYGIDSNLQIMDDLFSEFIGIEGAYNSTYFALSKIIEFTEKLKQQGLYDSAQIVIIADHGLPNNQKALTVDEAGKLNKFTTAYDSLLLVKERNSKTEFAENNDIFVTNADLQTIIEEGFKGNKFTDVIPPLRTFYYALQVQAHQPVKEYGVIKMNGTSLDTENWEIIEDYTP